MQGSFLNIVPPSRYGLLSLPHLPFTSFSQFNDNHTEAIRLEQDHHTQVPLSN